jgi:hypothetical protein
MDGKTLLKKMRNYCKGRQCCDCAFNASCKRTFIYDVDDRSIEKIAKAIDKLMLEDE